MGYNKPGTIHEPRVKFTYFHYRYSIQAVKPRTIHETRTKSTYFQHRFCKQVAILSQELYINQMYVFPI